MMNETVDLSEEQLPGIVLDSDGYAEWALKKRAEYITTRDVEIEHHQQQIELARLRCERSTAPFEFALREYLNRVPAHETKTQRSYCFAELDKTGQRVEIAVVLFQVGREKRERHQALGGQPRCGERQGNQAPGDSQRMNFASGGDYPVAGQPCTRSACGFGMRWSVVDAILFGIHAENAIMDVGSVIRFMLIFGPVCVMAGMFAMWDYYRACRLDDIGNAPGETAISTGSKTKNTTYSSTPAQKMQPPLASPAKEGGKMIDEHAPQGLDLRRLAMETGDGYTRKRPRLSGHKKGIPSWLLTQRDTQRRVQCLGSGLSLQSTVYRVLGIVPKKTALRKYQIADFGGRQNKMSATAPPIVKKEGFSCNANAQAPSRSTFPPAGRAVVISFAVE